MGSKERGNRGTIDPIYHVPVMPKIERSFGTHDGSFHADEVTACALLLLFDCIDRDQVKRTRDPAVLDRCEYVCDVGNLFDPKRKLFDHHQADYTGPLSSAGMVLEHLLEQGVISKGFYDFLNDALIIGVDAHDNGKAVQVIGHCTFSHVVSNFNPPEYNAPPNVQNAAFDKALDFVRGHLKRLKGRYEYIQSCREAVRHSMESSDKVLFFESALPWIENFFEMGGKEHPAKFVIMPSGPHWKLRGIPPSLDHRMDVRLPLPASWAGLSDEELQGASGIPGAVFCHKGRFISVWETKEDAFAAMEFTLNEGKKEI